MEPGNKTEPEADASMRVARPETAGPSAVPLAAKVAALKERSLYPERPASVEFVETHMSCVFLTDAFAYKLKKPVRYEFLDFTTMAQRRLSCEEELRLNRRLAPDVYLAVVPLTVHANGALALDGVGLQVDWLVKMRRLSASRMLDAAIASNALSDEDVDGVAGVLARFYAAAEPVATDPLAYPRRFERDIELSRRELLAHGLSLDEIDAPLTLQLRFLKGRRHLLERRALDGRIIEGHGDLRPEHVHLGPPPRIIDCLEFNRALRLVDPVDEICFLTMECERLGAALAGERVLAAYGAATGDRPPAQLALFYKSFRACLRARLAIWHLRDEVIDNPAKWVARAREYVQLSSRYAEALGRNAGTAP
jgi:uncharacterized protein